MSKVVSENHLEKVRLDLNLKSAIIKSKAPHNKDVDNNSFKNFKYTHPTLMGYPWRQQRQTITVN